MSRLGAVVGTTWVQIATAAACTLSRGDQGGFTGEAFAMVRITKGDSERLR